MNSQSVNHKSHSFQKSDFPDYLFYIFVYAFAAIAVIITVYPFLYVVSVSVSDPWAIVRGEIFLWPIRPTLNGYTEVFHQRGLWTAYGNTFYYTIVGTVLNMIATIIAAYPLSRQSFSGRHVFNFLLAFSMYFSGGMIPTYLLITEIGLYNNRWVMILPTLISAYNVMICRSAFSSVPAELLESAQLDGAGEWRMMTIVSVPLIMPTLAVLILYYAVAHWNDYMPALLYLSEDSLMPLQVLLRRILIQASTEFTTAGMDDEMRSVASVHIRYVTIIVATLPVLVIYPAIQRYFVKGIMLGAVKG